VIGGILGVLTKQKEKQAEVLEMERTLKNTMTQI
jgi:hypothetical protein